MRITTSTKPVARGVVGPGRRPRLEWFALGSEFGDQRPRCGRDLLSGACRSHGPPATTLTCTHSRRCRAPGPSGNESIQGGRSSPSGSRHQFRSWSWSGDGRSVLVGMARRWPGCWLLLDEASVPPLFVDEMATTPAEVQVLEAVSRPNGHRWSLGCFLCNSKLRHRHYQPDQ